MSSRKLKRVFTCTPVAFRGDHTFFSRDSGLLSVGFNMNGVDSRPVMPGVPEPDDNPILIRTDYANLCAPDWWANQSPDAVVFFSWAMPQYTPIARAIKASGAKLIIFLDSAGFWSPWSNGPEWFKVQWDACKRKHGLPLGALRYGASIGRSCIPAAFDRPRLEQMNLADAVTVTSPLVLARTKSFARAYGFRQVAHKINLLPLPVSPYMRYAGQKKRKRIVSVARWFRQDWPEKGPELLLGSLARFLAKRGDYEAIVVGRGASSLRDAHFYPHCLDRMNLQLIDYLPNKELPPLLSESQVSLCSSFHESYHIASFEAACCGCSIVALESPDLPALQLLAEKNGTLATNETPEAFALALLNEAGLWDRDLRTPESTARQWQTETHAENVAARAASMLLL